MVEYNDVASSIEAAYQKKLENNSRTDDTLAERLVEARDHALLCARSMGVQEVMAHLIVNEVALKK